MKIIFQSHVDFGLNKYCNDGKRYDRLIVWICRECIYNNRRHISIFCAYLVVSKTIQKNLKTTKTLGRKYTQSNIWKTRR